MDRPVRVPYGKRRSYLRLFFVLAALSLLAGLFTVPLFPVLTIRDTQTGRLLWQARVADGSTFALRWTHSINRTPVVERYRVQGTTLILTEISFEDYGIGMESELAPGEKLVMQDGRFTVTNMHREFAALPLFIGQVRAHHTLLFGGREIPLDTLDPPGSAVTIRVEKQPIIQQLEGSE